MKQNETFYSKILNKLIKQRRSVSKFLRFATQISARCNMLFLFENIQMLYDLISSNSI